MEANAHAYEDVDDQVVDFRRAREGSRVSAMIRNRCVTNGGSFVLLGERLKQA